jgi:hypothetical protein
MADQCQALRELPLLSGNRVLAIGVASSRPSSPSSVTAFFGLLLFFPAGVSPGGRPLRFTAGIGAGVSCPASFSRLQLHEELAVDDGVGEAGVLLRDHSRSFHGSRGRSGAA